MRKAKMIIKIEGQEPREYDTFLAVAADNLMVGGLVDGQLAFLEPKEGARIVTVAWASCTTPVLAKMINSTASLIANILSALPPESATYLIQEMQKAAVTQSDKSPDISEVSVREIHPSEN